MCVYFACDKSYSLSIFSTNSTLPVGDLVTRSLAPLSRSKLPNRAGANGVNGGIWKLFLLPLGVCTSFSTPSTTPISNELHVSSWSSSVVGPRPLLMLSSLPRRPNTSCSSCSFRAALIESASSKEVVVIVSRAMWTDIRRLGREAVWAFFQGIKMRIRSW
jgi:hypothetical protein